MSRVIEVQALQHTRINPSRRRNTLLSLDETYMNEHEAALEEFLRVSSIPRFHAVSFTEMRGTLFDTLEMSDAAGKLLQDRSNTPVQHTFLALLRAATQEHPTLPTLNPSDFRELNREAEAIHMNRHYVEDDGIAIPAGAQTKLQTEHIHRLYNPSYRFQFTPDVDNQDGVVSLSEMELYASVALTRSPCLSMEMIAEMLKYSVIWVDEIFTWNKFMTDELIFGVFALQTKEGIPWPVSSLASQLNNIRNLEDQISALQACINDAVATDGTIDALNLNLREWVRKLMPDESLDNIADSYLSPLLMELLKEAEPAPIHSVIKRYS